MDCITYNTKFQILFLQLKQLTNFWWNETNNMYLVDLAETLVWLVLYTTLFHCDELVDNVSIAECKVNFAIALLI